jgi:glucose-1-phosphate adenylyltransferase
VQGGATIVRSVLGVRTRIAESVTVRNSVLIGADRFETDQERAENQRRGIPDMTVGSGTVIENAILDKDCRVGSNVRIVNRHQTQNEDGKNYVIREGITVIPKGAVVLDGTVI